MDDKITAYIQSLALDVFNSPTYTYIEGEARSQLFDKIMDHLQLAALDLIIDNLEDDQVDMLNGKMDDISYISQKIEEFCSSDPSLMIMLEEGLADEIEIMK